MTERKVKVKVKFGKRIYCTDDLSIDKALVIVTNDAKTRLISAFPQVEDIQIETSVDNYTSYDGSERTGVQASAYGYVFKGNKARRFIIKDIKSTKLYQTITEKIEKANESVIAYDIMFMKKYEKKHYVKFSGKGDIPWEQLKDAINRYNEEVINSGRRKDDLLVIKPDNFYVDNLLINGVWRGYILLSDGSWLEIKDSYSSCDDSWYTNVKRYCPPKLDIPDSNFEVRISNKDES